MKITIIHGQNHKGSTYTVTRELAEKLNGEITEFFLPRDFAQPCLGCYTCFQKDLTHCPHFAKLQPLSDALLAADVILLDSPVYVYHATGQMMSFLDHFGTWWTVHRPRPEMCGKQAVAICTAAGGGMKSTCRDLADSLEMWGVRRVFRLGLGVRAIGPAGIPAGVQRKIRRKTDALAKKLRAGVGKRGENARGRKWFYIMRLFHKVFPPSEPDFGYWERRGWHGRQRPWKQPRKKGE